MVKYHGVLEQVNHNKIPQCFETLWYTIHLPYTMYEKAWSTTFYHVMSWYSIVYHVIPWYIFIRDIGHCNNVLQYIKI